MIGIATRNTRINSYISKFLKKESKFLLCNSIKLYTSFKRGYAGIINEKNLRIRSKKEELYIDKVIDNVRRKYCVKQDLQTSNFLKISNETLESLSEYFDELIEEATHLDDADVSSGDGVLTIKFGRNYGTYVINRQIPNQQIWLSSPKTGPKRYDFIDGTWIYKHDGKSLHELLNDEIPEIVKHSVSFNKCSYSGREK